MSEGTHWNGTALGGGGLEDTERKGKSEYSLVEGRGGRLTFLVSVVCAATAYVTTDARCARLQILLYNHPKHTVLRYIFDTF